ncbi:hypothetical protein BGX23_006512 [Mortierella sp. AD031]|nr:hypothetical protein BGX23_006512 [Mortierella sp. AD031]
MSVSADQQTLTLWDSIPGGLVVNYSISANTWALVPGVGTTGNNSVTRLKAATDPTTGLVYIPKGTNNLFVYQFGKGPLAPELMPPLMVDGLNSYTWVWNEVRESFFLFGGETTEPYMGTYFQEFSPSKRSWIVLPTSGPMPPRTTGSCMVPAHNGTKMILFGGNDAAGISVGTLFILDVTNLTWTAAQGVQPAQYRTEMACSVSGDNFIAWGGKTFAQTHASNCLH